VADIQLRNRVPQQVSFLATIAACSVGGVLIIAGIVILLSSDNTIAGLMSIVGGATLATFSLILNALVSIAAKAEANINRSHNLLLDMEERIKRMEPMLKLTSDNSQISDAVRSITHRENERDALRQAIREEMYSGDWEAAAYLINEMERRFGYKQEAENLRQELASARVMTIEEKITEAVGHIDKILGDRHWDRARAEIERLIKLFPRHERVLGLPKDLAARRETHKQELLVKWNQAVARNEIDEGITLLIQLDQYLTREEAQNLQDSARDVFKARLVNLGVQFGLAVSEHRWRDALEAGLQIRKEFPNSRMAQEVSQRLETLRVRAGFKADAEVTLRQAPAN
jgi:hypothetical protein